MVESKHWKGAKLTRLIPIWETLLGILWSGLVLALIMVMVTVMVNVMVMVNVFEPLGPMVVSHQYMTPPI